LASRSSQVRNRSLGSVEAIGHPGVVGGICVVHDPVRRSAHSVPHARRSSAGTLSWAVPARRMAGATSTRPIVRSFLLANAWRLVRLCARRQRARLHPLLTTCTEPAVHRSIPSGWASDRACRPAQSILHPRRSLDNTVSCLLGVRSFWSGQPGASVCPVARSTNFKWTDRFPGRHDGLFWLMEFNGDRCPGSADLA